MDLEKQALNFGRYPALIVVDMTRGFTDPESPLGAECETVKAAIARLLSLFREMNWPVFFTSVEYDHPDQARVFRQKIPALNILNVGSSWVALDASMARQADEVVIRKFWASGFFGTDLAQQLRALGVDSLVVTGLTTSGCVRATAVDGLQHDFPVIVPQEATGDRNQAAHNANLHDLNAKYVEVMPLDEAIQKLKSVAQPG